ncbi:MAG TPA: DUF2752 domain-containing protein [Pyrinomonadaceae bacterium]|nr:DUF2752 domain-containing protein [Pyrinomonadaceae bacterium]HMP64556.1 DUF2752 domain-containing protein [Pyrinomonadaceae bacterium]
MDPAPEKLEKPASPFERKIAAAGFSAMTAGAGLVWYIDPARASFMPACPLFITTGFACSGCGLTRGFHALFHGDIVTSLEYNALIPVFIVVFGFFYVSMFLVAVRGYAFPRWTLSLPAVWGFLGLLLVFGIVRNIPAYPFTLLFP